MGAEGLKEAAEVSVLNANYLLRKISEIGAFELPYDGKRRRKHECVFTAAKLQKQHGVRALDVSKRLLDYGVHAPTIYFPQIVDEALMIEPTESFEKEELDRFVGVLRKIAEEAKTSPEVVLEAPQNTAVRRLDEVKASHPRTMVLSWRKYLKQAP